MPACRVCEKTFLRNSQLNRHMRKHDSKNQHCNSWSKSFWRKDVLHRHKKNVHGLGKTMAVRCQLKCEYCSKTFKTKFNLLRHMEGCKQIHCRGERLDDDKIMEDMTCNVNYYHKQLALGKTIAANLQKKKAVIFLNNLFPVNRNIVNKRNLKYIYHDLFVLLVSV